MLFTHNLYPFFLVEFCIVITKALACHSNQLNGLIYQSIYITFQEPFRESLAIASTWITKGDITQANQKKNLNKEPQKTRPARPCTWPLANP
ncbi:MAG: hypothetical protein BGO39_28710 [Chloroflexi bacterium 54-19]|nr:MAG: hypothetical protein BGO39_28710 [Chloroflexi bacterium 54-19]